jgi:hypothetical protein
MVDCLRSFQFHADQSIAECCRVGEKFFLAINLLRPRKCDPPQLTLASRKVVSIPSVRRRCDHLIKGNGGSFRDWTNSNAQAVLAREDQSDHLTIVSGPFLAISTNQDE